jgi:hypothetical protein
MASRDKRLWGIDLGVAAAAGVSVLALAIWFLSGHGAGELADDGLLWKRLGRPLLRTVVFVAAGLFIGQLIEGLGWTNRLGVLAGPLMRLARLPREAGAAFSAAFASGVAANTLLYTAWREKHITRRELVLANLLNAGIPAYLLHLPTTFFVVYALIGRAALIYFGLTFSAAVLRSAAVVVAGRLGGTPPTEDPPPRKAPPNRSKVELWQETWKKFRIRIRRMLLVVVPVYIVVFLLAQGGFFRWAGRALAGAVSSRAVPVESMGVIVFAVAAEFTGGFATAGALMQSGSLGVKEVVTALLIGNVVATPVRALRHQLPHYMGIYSPGTGARLLAIGQGSRVAGVLLVTALYILWG